MRTRVILVATATALLLGSCGRVPVPGLPDRKPDTMTISIYAEEGANGGVDVPVDIVFAKGQIVEQLSGMTAPDWFAQRARVLDQFKDDIFLRDYVVVSGSGTSAAFEERKDAEAVFVFAGYAAAGDHAYRLDRAENYVIRLGEDAYTAEARKK